jgi:transcription antitermination factor NusG
MVDNRDELTWVTLELTKPGEEKALEGKLAPILRNLLGVDDTFPVFVPYLTYNKGGRTVCMKLIEGYSFVATGLSEVRYFALEKSPFVATVFSSRKGSGFRVLHTIPNSEIDRMKARMAESVGADMEMGARVRIVSGNYRDLEGYVVDIFDGRVAVRIEFRSITTITVVPQNMVMFASEEADSRNGDSISLDEALGSENS